MFSAVLPITKKTMILSKYHLNDVNTKLLESTVSTGKKKIDFSLFIVTLYVVVLGPYPKHFEISSCMCNFHKASLLCKFLTNFYVFL